MRTLGESGCIAETIMFSAGQRLTYALKISARASGIFARFENEEITIEIPAQTARDWIETDLIGLEYEQEVDGKTNLKITIEKDFVCVERPFDADNADAFPHPKVNC